MFITRYLHLKRKSQAATRDEPILCGSTQGSSTVKFNGTAGTPTSWNATSIVVPVPSGATTGDVVVTVSGTASNGVAFTVTTAGPTIYYYLEDGRTS